MEINVRNEGNKTVLALVGRLDTTTAPLLEEKVNEVLPAVKDLEFDFTDLAYVSSAGLRVILSTLKAMKGKGEFVITHVSDDINEVFEMTGFSSLLTIK